MESMGPGVREKLKGVYGLQEVWGPLSHESFCFMPASYFKGSSGNLASTQLPYVSGPGPSLPCNPVTDMQGTLLLTNAAHHFNV